MVIEVTAQTVITFAALLSAIGGIVALIVKLVRWVDNQKAQDGKITALEEKHEADMKEMREGIQLSVDGQAICGMQNMEEITIIRSPHDALLIRFEEERNYFSLLKDKLSQWSL